MFVTFAEHTGDIAIRHIVRIMPASQKTCVVHLTNGQTVALEMSRKDARDRIDAALKGHV